MSKANYRVGRVRVLFVIPLLMLFTSCVSAEPEVVLKGKRFKVELATTSKEHALGLMFRDSLAEDRGMLFIFSTATTRNFWMRNTRIPLDILYFDESLRLVSVAQGAKPCHTARCPTYSSTGPARYVLELNAGKAAELGVEPGDLLELDLD